MQELGKWIIGVAIILFILGISFYFFGDKLNWMGRLPGDIRIEKENVKVYIPITTMILFSILFMIIFRLWKIFF
ncbi:MAG TPA: DUF2905 domain-containing protein [Saprospiraceae bacterium]|nr:DUF2905 domain-containing protein [Saprospiraceae bacterium]